MRRLRSQHKALKPVQLQKKLLLYLCALKCFLYSWPYGMSCTVEKNVFNSEVPKIK